MKAVNAFANILPPPVNQLCALLFLGENFSHKYETAYALMTNIRKFSSSGSEVIAKINACEAMSIYILSIIYKWYKKSITFFVKSLI
jgi:dynactin complex subunit